MVLWHFLTKSRLDEKIKYAKLHDNELWLHPPLLSQDISQGKLSKYIYCLPSILSGMNFGDGEELCLVRIKLKESARINIFRGNPKALDYESLGNNYDVVDMTVDAAEFSSIRFRQFLLLNPNVVESWSFDQSQFQEDFNRAYARLTQGEFLNEAFFMIDFHQDEVIAAAELNGSLMGFKSLDATEIQKHQVKLESALVRLGAK